MKTFSFILSLTLISSLAHSRDYIERSNERNDLPIPAEAQAPTLGGVTVTSPSYRNKKISHRNKKMIAAPIEGLSPSSTASANSNDYQSAGAQEARTFAPFPATNLNTPIAQDSRRDSGQDSGIKVVAGIPNAPKNNCDVEITPPLKEDSQGNSFGNIGLGVTVRNIGACLGRAKSEAQAVAASCQAPGRVSATAWYTDDSRKGPIQVTARCTGKNLAQRANREHRAPASDSALRFIEVGADTSMPAQWGRANSNGDSVEAPDFSEGSDQSVYGFK